MLISGHLNGSLCFWDRRSHKSVHEVAGLHTQQIVSVAVGLQSGISQPLQLSATVFPLG